jgi:hypothetical protein
MVELLIGFICFCGLCKHYFFQKFFCKEGAHCTSCYVAVGFFFLVLQNRTIGFEIKLLRRNCIGSEGRTRGQTDIYYYIPPSRWIAGGIAICAVSNFINTGKNFGGGVIWVFLI